MSRVDDALRVIEAEVIGPALEDAELSQDIRNKVENSRRWLKSFHRVGDLLVYLHRFDAGKNDPIYQALKARGLRTFEDLAPELEAQFGQWAGDVTSVSDFIVGETYPTSQIHIFAGSYDMRAGGMFVLEAEGRPSAVVIKATLKGGKYPNDWLEPHERLKYYLKSRSENFGEEFKENAAILKNPSIPILTFTRHEKGSPFVYEGEFRFDRIHRETDGSKWFELVRSDVDKKEAWVVRERLESELADEISEAKSRSAADRNERISVAPKLPRKVRVISTGFVRNADVIAEVLERADGICEYCGGPAPFKRATDGTPYLEVHHVKPLADGGYDTVDNAVAICPNCHREAHFG